MAQACGICEDDLGNVPRTELLCHHFFHTSCFLLNMGDDCAVCHEPFVQEAQVDEGEDEAEDQASVHSNDSNLGYTRIRTLYENNSTFRRDIKTYMHSCTSVSKPQKEFKALLAVKKAELTPTYTLIKAQVEGLYNVRKDEIMNSEQYKVYKKAEGRLMRYYSHLQTKYNIRTYQLSALHHIPGLKRLKRPSYRYWTTPARLIRRALRLQLPRYRY